MPNLEVKKELEELLKMYKAKPGTDTMKALVCGSSGSGKTMLLSTAPKPILIDSFDPGGTKTIRDEIEKGGVYVVQHDLEDMNNNTIYQKWDAEFQRRLRSGFFNNIATYAIDSATTWIRAMLNYSSSKGSKGVTPSLRDYGITSTTVVDIIALIHKLPCHFFLTGHTEEDKDESDGSMIIRLASFKSNRVNIPPLFDEVYVMRVKPSSSKPIYEVQTAQDGKYVAKTRLGSHGRLALFEKPDIREILKKVGLPYEDKNL